MVSFEDIRNMRLRHHTPEPLEMRLTFDLIVFYIFSLCFLISMDVSTHVTSSMSLLGMYYAIGDITVYYYRNYIAMRHEAEKLNQESDDEAPNDSEDNSELENHDDDNEVASDMMPNLFRKTNTSDQEYDNDYRNKMALQQLREFEESIRQKNLGIDDFSDIPPLVKLDSPDLSSTNLLYYMNPNLRQPGQYSASLNETDE